MVHRKYFIPLVLIFCFTYNSAKAQKLFIGFGTGYNKIINDNYFSYQTKDNDKFGLGIDGLYQFTAKIEYQLSSLPIFLISDLSYLSRSKRYTYKGILNFVDSHFTNITIKSSLNIYSLKLGIKYPMELKYLSPYVSINLLANYFNELNITQNPRPDNIFNFTPKTISSSLKFGFSIGTGTNYKINNQFHLGLSVNYSLMNLTGKKDVSSYIKEDSMDLLSISANIFYRIFN